MITENDLINAGYEVIIDGDRFWYWSRTDRIKHLTRSSCCPYCGSRIVMPQPNIAGMSQLPIYSCLQYECGVIAALGMELVYVITKRTEQCMACCETKMYLTDDDII